MHPADDEPKCLLDHRVREHRLGRLREPHIAPLTDLVIAIRDERGCAAEVPYFDPCDGGIKARALFLLEAPGRRAVQSGFVSRNNPDETAKNLLLLLRDAGIPRCETVLWNIVPWYLGHDGRIRPAMSLDIQAGQKHLTTLLPLLERLKVIGLLGRRAQEGRRIVAASSPCPIIDMFHPSPRCVNTSQDRRRSITCDCEAIAQILKQEDSE